MLTWTAWDRYSLLFAAMLLKFEVTCNRLGWSCDAPNAGATQ